MDRNYVIITQIAFILKLMSSGIINRWMYSFRIALITIIGIICYQRVVNIWYTSTYTCRKKDIVRNSLVRLSTRKFGSVINRSILWISGWPWLCSTLIISQLTFTFSLIFIILIQHLKKAKIYTLSFH